MRRTAIHLLPVAVLFTGALACSPPAAEEEAALDAEASQTAESTAAGESADSASRPPKSQIQMPAWAEHIDELEPAVLGWAAAWAGQDVDAYLSHYSESFRPAGEISRQHWEEQRRVRLTRPNRIDVQLTDFRQTGSSSKWRGERKLEVVKVEFRQKYESDSYADEVAKTLELEYVDDGWKITDERAG